MNGFTPPVIGYPPHICLAILSRVFTYLLLTDMSANRPVDRDLFLYDLMSIVTSWHK